MNQLEALMLERVIRLCNPEKRSPLNRNRSCPNQFRSSNPARRSPSRSKRSCPGQSAHLRGVSAHVLARSAHVRVVSAHLIMGSAHLRAITAHELLRSAVSINYVSEPAVRSIEKVWPVFAYTEPFIALIAFNFSWLTSPFSYRSLSIW